MRELGAGEGELEILPAGEGDFAGVGLEGLAGGVGEARSGDGALAVAEDPEA